MQLPLEAFDHGSQKRTLRVVPAAPHSSLGEPRFSRRASFSKEQPRKVVPYVFFYKNFEGERESPYLIQVGLWKEGSHFPRLPKLTTVELKKTKIY